MEGGKGGKGKGEGGRRNGRGEGVHSLPTYVLQGNYSFIMNPLFTSYMMMSIQYILYKTFYTGGAATPMYPSLHQMNRWTDRETDR